MAGSSSERPGVTPRVLRARLLGTLDLRLGDEALAPFESGRLESLLAYLLLHRDAPQPRQRLGFRLWPDSTERQALRAVLPSGCQLALGVVGQSLIA